MRVDGSVQGELGFVTQSASSTSVKFSDAIHLMSWNRQPGLEEAVNISMPGKAILFSER